MFEVLLVTLQLGLNIVVPAWIVRRDLARLRPEQLCAAWNDASFWSAVVAFGPLCVPVHFFKVRRNVLGLLLGFAWMFVAVVLSGVSNLLLSSCVDKLQGH